MCGIFGILMRQGATVSASRAQALMADLFELSESRGKESAGLHVYHPVDGRAWTLKAARRASDLLASEDYRRVLPQALAGVVADSGASQPVALLAHSRLVTNGTAALAANNQPVRSGSVTVIHNGICVNVDALWAAHPHLRRLAEVDTEVMAALLDEAAGAGTAAPEATQRMYAQLRGAASIAWADDQRPQVTLATNTGDLYYADRLDEGYLVFASERYILDNAIRRAGIAASLHPLVAGTGLTVDLMAAGPAAPFDLAGLPPGLPAAPRLQRVAAHQDGSIGAERPPAVLVSRADEGLLRYSESRMRAMRRCTRCILPETFPFIAFDGEGVCNYCRSYRPRYGHMDPEGSKRDFIASLERYRRAGGEPDALVAFSGGRDSSYGLHLIKKEFGLKPITFTYDWGMVTDLARRNVARICGQLGIQNILVSADIAAKRDNIRMNVSAWLKRPDLGVVPLFMAGDKHFFKVSNQLKRQTGIALDLWCANPLENTDFKSGFCGVSPDFDKSRVDYLSWGRKAKMAGYYALQFLKNPAYLNPSLVDTVGAFMAYYVEPRRDFYFIFDHFTWNESEVNKTLLGQYDWELSPDSPSTWRIGDGTAPFYNYIYLSARGFSEFDTFRSNQIREGHIDRAQALESVLVENRPRAASLRWYLETIGLEFDPVIRRINELDTLGLHRA